MARLTKGMYGSYMDPKLDLFVLYSGQMRGRKIMIGRNAGWFNKLGERLGWGDLSTQDFRRIAKGLNKGELFIVLSESDSRFSSSLKSAAKEEMDFPGVDHVLKTAMYVIARRKVYIVDRYSSIKEKKWI